MNDSDYMRLALELASRGAGQTSPNPMAGAVIVKDGRVIGKGWHEFYGGKHAEVNALEACSEDPKGAVMYATLEPCCHQGKQPPCTDAIIQAGISRVVVGAGDPNPLVNGKGVAALRDHGIEVTENVLNEECSRLNEVFFHYVRTKRPFVAMKYAMTMDGKIATRTDESKWITGEAARTHAQTLRNKYSAIMVGVGTVFADDPMLTCHMEGGRDPIRIICDSRLRTPLNARVITTAQQTRTIIATGSTNMMKREDYERRGCEIMYIKPQNGHVDIDMLLEKLGEAGVDSVLIEGGGELNWSALESRVVNRIYAYIAPKIFGGRDAKTPVDGEGVLYPSQAFALRNCEMTRLGDDLLIESEIEYDVHGDR